MKPMHLSSATLAFLLVPLSAEAALIENIPGCDFVTGQVAPSCMIIYMAHLIREVFKFTGVICIVVIMIGGYELVLGNAIGGKERGQSRIQFGIIGMIVCASSLAIVDFIVSSLMN